MRTPWLFCVLTLAACQSGASVGASCVRGSDCSAPLVCTFGRCRTECAAARDCPAGQVCLIDGAGQGACELPAIDVCSASCDPPLVCAAGHCRVECTGASDCPAGHDCVASACERAPDVDGGAVDMGSVDGGTTDAGSSDTDAGSLDAGDAALRCDPVNDAGCGVGERCGFVGPAVGCVAAGGTGTVGASCTVEADCAAGHSCQGLRCVRICRLGDGSVCGPDSACTADSVSGQTRLTTDTGIGLCSERCDLLADTGCTMGTCAFGTGGSGNDFTWCRDVGTFGEGHACGAEYQCAAGLGCHHGACRHFCRLGTGDCGSETCDPISTFSSLPQVGECEGPDAGPIDAGP